MSVINQMLKDLEQRSPESGRVAQPSVVVSKKSTLKIVLVSALVLLSLNALGFYIWDLQTRVAISESNQQKNINTQISASVSTSPVVKVIEQNNQVQSQAAQQAAQKAVTSTKKTEQMRVSQQATSSIKSVSVPAKVSSPPLEKIEAKPTVQLVKNTATPETKTVQPSSIKSTNTGQMSVSRRELTSKELITQKLTRAEKALNSNEITKAENLFEEILIINPEHKQARKKLAALWFGRKSYQEALNLLSQGINIDKQDAELRLMKARIHLKKGEHAAAYNTLKPLASFEQEEYQVMFANLAQQIEQYSSAIGAYQVLIKMQPYSGRWHLGLAIVYDKNSQFTLAVNEYALALTKADLSASSAKFAAQRLQALGE